MIGKMRALFAMAIPPQRQSEQTPEVRPPASTSRTARILITEDEFLVGMAIEQALLDAGHEIVAVVTSGEEAVREASRLRPDLVLMDIRLAGLITGIEAAVALKALGVPSLFTSAHSDAATRLAGERAMPLGWLTKPFSASEAVGAVAAALAQSTNN